MDMLKVPRVGMVIEIMVVEGAGERRERRGGKTSSRRPIYTVRECPGSEWADGGSSDPIRSDVRFSLIIALAVHHFHLFADTQGRICCTSIAFTMLQFSLYGDASLVTSGIVLNEPTL